MSCLHGNTEGLISTNAVTSEECIFVPGKSERKYSLSVFKHEKSGKSPSFYPKNLLIMLVVVLDNCPSCDRYVVFQAD